MHQQMDSGLSEAEITATVTQKRTLMYKSTKNSQFFFSNSDPSSLGQLGAFISSSNMLIFLSQIKTGRTSPVRSMSHLCASLSPTICSGKASRCQKGRSVGPIPRLPFSLTLSHSVSLTVDQKNPNVSVQHNPQSVP